MGVMSGSENDHRAGLTTTDWTKNRNSKKKKVFSHTDFFSSLITVIYAGWREFSRASDITFRQHVSTVFSCAESQHERKHSEVGCFVAWWRTHTLYHKYQVSSSADQVRILRSPPAITKLQLLRNVTLLVWTHSCDLWHPAAHPLPLSYGSFFFMPATCAITPIMSEMLKTKEQRLWSKVQRSLKAKIMLDPCWNATPTFHAHLKK